LLIVPDYSEALYLSSRNIPNADTVLLSDVNTYEIVNADVLVLTEGAAKIFSEEETV
jgi:large subunit ribosomal protein L4